MSQRIACVRVPRPPTAAAPGAEAAVLAGALLAVAPRVTPVIGHPLAFWADASGMERRGGDPAIAQALLAAARDAGFAEARVGIAGSCVAASLATRERGSAWRVVPPGRDASFVGRRSLDLLPIETAMRDALRLLGLRTCGELARLEAADVELRWGAEGVCAWRLARGEDPRWPFRPSPPNRAAADAEWEPPIEGTEPLRFVLRGLIASVVAQAAERQRLPAALRLTLHLDDAPDEAYELRPARPTGDARVLRELADAMLERIASAGGLPAPITGARLDVVEEGVGRADQLDAFRPAAPDPVALHGALLPLLARWGEGAIVRAAPHGAHLPAARTEWEERGAEVIAELAKHRARTHSVSRTHPVRADLPLCLRRFPEPRAARVTLDEQGRPARVEVAATGAWPPISGAVWAEGPERLSGEWWASGYAREYWLAESADGCLWLLFRDGRKGEWSVEGWWD